MADFNDLLLQALEGIHEEQRQTRQNLHALRNDVNTGFGTLNGRLKKVEGDVFRIKAVWTAVTATAMGAWVFVGEWVKSKVIP